MLTKINDKTENCKKIANFLLLVSIPWLATWNLYISFAFEMMITSAYEKNEDGLNPDGDSQSNGRFLRRDGHFRKKAQRGKLEIITVFNIRFK